MEVPHTKNIDTDIDIDIDIDIEMVVSLGPGKMLS